MGTQFLFTCPDCGYEAEVSGGGDAGMIAASETILCLDCKELSDITTTIWAEGNPMDVREEFPLQCDKNENHTVRLWEHPDNCPRCGQQMEKGDFTMIWD